MNAEFNVLYNALSKINNGSAITIAMENLEKKITEVEKRMVCINKTARDIELAISKHTESVDSNEAFVMNVNDHDTILRGSHDIMIALDLGDTEPIENNWYGLFEEPKKEEPKVIWEKGTIIEWNESIKYYSAKGGARARVTEDYTTLCDLVKVEFLDDLSNGQVNGGYYGYMFKDEPIKETPPTSQCRNQHTFDKVKEVIQILKTLNNGDCIDGETMQYILKEVGMEDQMLRQLIMSNPESEPSDFPDLWYNGLENNYSDKPIKDEETYLGNIEKGITNLKVYANDYGYKLYIYSNGNLMTECELLDSDHVWRELKARDYKKSIRKVVLSML